MSIQIHGKTYITVAERITMAGDNLMCVTTEVLQHAPVVVVKATVKIDRKDQFIREFTGISSANPTKTIEKTNPYEVAETSAVGRALGFAGFGIDGGIASADEMQKYPENSQNDVKQPSDTKEVDNQAKCPYCGSTDLPLHNVGCKFYKEPKGEIL